MWLRGASRRLTLTENREIFVVTELLEFDEGHEFDEWIEEIE